MGDKKGTYTTLLWRPEGKRPLRRPRRRWEDNIKLDRQKAGWGGMDWIDLLRTSTGDGLLCML